MKKLSAQLDINSLYKNVRRNFEQVSDYRHHNTKVKLVDVLSSGYCLFALKYPSLLSFEDRFGEVDQNLKNIFGIESIPSDTTMRTILDKLDPEEIRPIFKDFVLKLQKEKQLDKFNVKVNSKEYLTISVDGTGYFSSKKVSGPCCLEKTHRSGETTYYHQLLGASIVKPDMKTVIPICPEAIIKQDGDTKNDCERNAAKRLIKKIRQDYPELSIIIVEDALSANEPHINLLRTNNCEYILGAKPGSNKFLFKKFNFEKRRNNIQNYLIKIGKITHEFEFINQVYLKGTGSLKVNFISYYQKEKGKKDLHFGWITSFKVTSENVLELMKIARSRWKVENETFNTLKNQGYHFEHNFGHGYKNLSVVFAYLMMLAFLIDQIIQLTSPIQQQILLKLSSKKKMWKIIESAVFWTECQSMQEIYELILAKLDSS